MIIKQKRLRKFKCVSQLKERGHKESRFSKRTPFTEGHKNTALRVSPGDGLAGQLGAFTQSDSFLWILCFRSSSIFKNERALANTQGWGTLIHMSLGRMLSLLVHGLLQILDKV